MGEGPVMAFLNRVVYKREAARIFASLQPETRSCAEISGGLGRGVGFRSFEEFHYPEHDICKDVFRDGEGKIRRFDMIIADQVWEHLDRPYTATRHVLEMLNPGGAFYLCVPFYVRYHAFPVDCSRWTARGLKNLLIEAGFDEASVTADQWGNLDSARRDCARKWAKYDPKIDTLDNDPDFPSVAWAVAINGDARDP
jgi:SAM-dependent methyltransferase